MDSRVRQAVPRDAEAIASIHTRRWQAAYRGILPDAFLDKLGQELEPRTRFWRGEIASPEMAGHEVWISELASKCEIQGFASIGPTRDVDLVAAGEVYAIYLDPNRWGLGLGRELFSHASNRLASLGYLSAMLWVLDSNTRARRFYEIAGWTTDGATKIEKRPGFELHEVRYRKSLR